MSRLVVWSRRLVSNLRFQRSFLKTDSCDRALSRSGVSNLRYLQLIFETCSSDRDAFGASVSNLRFQRWSRRLVSNLRFQQWLFETGIWGWVMSRLVVWSRQFVSNLRFQRSLLKTDSCDWALSRSGVSNLWYLQLIFETCSSDQDTFGASVLNLRFQRSYF